MRSARISMVLFATGVVFFLLGEGLGRNSVGGVLSPDIGLIDQGQQAPNVVLHDGAGNVARLANYYATGPLVLLLVAPQCSSCLGEATRFTEEPLPSGMRRVIAFCGLPEEARALRATLRGSDVPVLLCDEEARESLRFTVSPTAYLFARSGAVLAAAEGPKALELLKEQ